MQEHKKPRQTAVTYGVLCACLLAAGVGAWIAARDTVGMQPQTSATAAPTTTEAYTDWAAAALPAQEIPAGTLPSETQSETETRPAEKKYVYPLGTYIVKDYSHGNVVYSATMEDWRVHSGVDFGDNRGQSVLAMGDGTVLEVQTDALWGVVVVIDHGSGVVARYCGLAKDGVPAAGAKVSRGEVIGTLDEVPVESKDGPHLHFEVTVNGAAADPLEVLRSGA